MTLAIDHVTHTPRLQFADDLFARRHRSRRRSPVANLWTWRLNGRYDPARLTLVARGLAAGGLSRRLLRAQLPGARDLWVNADRPPNARFEAEVLPAAQLSAWLTARHRDHLDPHEGITYQLSAVDLDDGTAVVALVLAHAAGDGGAVIDAVLRADAGDPLRLPPAPETTRARLQAELADAVGQIQAIRQWAKARRKAKQAGTAALIQRDPAVFSKPRANPEAWQMQRLIVELDSSVLEQVAARHGGTLNAWFMAALARILVAIDHVPVDGSPVPVSLPMSEFKPGDWRANSTRVTRALLPRQVLENKDLAAVRAAAKEAYTRLNAAGAGLVPVPLALIQMLPDAIVDRLPQPPQAACLASSLGALAPEYVHVMGDDVRCIAGYAGYQETSSAEVRAMGGGLTAWLLKSGPRTTFNILGLEPDRIPTQADLQRLVVDEIASWGLVPEVW